VSIQDVVVYRRENLGKQESKRLRKSGLTPSVVYGMGGESLSVSVEPRAIGKVLHSEKGLNTVLNLRLEGTEQTRHVMIKSVDRHPVTDRLVHIDFMRIDMDKAVIAAIPIEVTGTPAGVKMGGVLAIVRHEVEVECLPRNLPGSIQVDVSALGMNDALRIKDLPQFEGVTYLLGPERTVVVVHPPEAVIEETEEEEVEAVEAPEEVSEES